MLLRGCSRKASPPRCFPRRIAGSILTTMALVLGSSAAHGRSRMTRGRSWRRSPSLRANYVLPRHAERRESARKDAQETHAPRAHPPSSSPPVISVLMSSPARRVRGSASGHHAEQRTWLSVQGHLPRPGAEQRMGWRSPDSTQVIVCISLSAQSRGIGGTMTLQSPAIDTEGHSRLCTRLASGPRTAQRSCKAAPERCSRRSAPQRTRD